MATTTFKSDPRSDPAVKERPQPRAMIAGDRHLVERRNTTGGFVTLMGDAEVFQGVCEQERY